jgi:HemY protein
LIRGALAVFIACLLIVAAISLQGDPGAASLTWLGWRADTTAAAGVLLIGLLALLATVFWRLLLWIVDAPRRAARLAAEARRRQGQEALARGFLESAAGNGPEARRLAARAADLAQDQSQLVRLLAAHAAEAAGDRTGAESAWRAMLGFPDMRLAAHRGLRQSALSAGDAAEALANAQAAFNLPHTAPWAWRALFEAKLEVADWSEALALTETALERKVVSPLVAGRARAALQTALADEADSRGAPAEALEAVTAAAKARPDFTPAAVLAARLQMRAGRGNRAAQILEAAWQARAHPAIWLAWRDLVTDETPPARAERLGRLVALSPNARETRFLRVEQAMTSANAEGVRRAAAALEGEPVTQRLAGLMARAASLLGDRDGARAWIARGAGAPEEPDWTDIDPAGRAFAFHPADQARAVLTYAETGDLAHPRAERGEPGMSDLPDLPAAYAASAAFVGAAEAGLPPIVDDGGFGEALQPDDAPAKRPFLGFRR